MKLIRLLGSFKIAVFLIASLLTLLIVSTTFESVYGIEFAQITFYQANWFDLFLSLFGINIFFATLSRWPFKKYHTGFIVTHIGILLLLGGSLLSRLLGVEGQLTLFEGEKWDQIRTSGYDVVVAASDGKNYVFEIPMSQKNARHKLKLPGSEEYLYLEEIRSDLSEKITVSDNGEYENAAVQLNLKSTVASVDQDIWLIEDSPYDPYANEQTLGPAKFRLITGASLQAEEPEEINENPVLILRNSDGDVIGEISVDSIPQTPFNLEGSGLTVTSLRYFKAAVVEDGQLQEHEDPAKFNPAIEITAENASGDSETHTKFFLFPDFESMHGIKTERSLNLSVELNVPIPEHLKKKQPALNVFFRDGMWSYELQSSKASEEGGLTAGQTIQSPWMDMQITVKQLITRGDVSYTVSADPLSDRTFYGARIRSSDHEEWVVPHRPAVYQGIEGPVTASINMSSYDIPFIIKLKDFRKVDYPGSREAMSFESDVQVYDRTSGKTIDTTIQMNEPLDVAGYRIFQSSYIQDPENGEASVFTIAKNPGLLYQYAGSIILGIGIFILFYIRPLSSASRIHGGSKS